MSGRQHEPTAKEKSLRVAIIASAASGIPIAPAAAIGWTTVWIILTVLAGISGGYVTLFYAVWLLGVLFESNPYHDPPELIGDAAYDAPPLYWPWGSYQRRIRQVRRIREIESEIGIRDPYPIG